MRAPQYNFGLDRKWNKSNIQNNNFEKPVLCNGFMKNTNEHNFYFSWKLHNTLVVIGLTIYACSDLRFFFDSNLGLRCYYFRMQAIRTFILHTCIYIYFCMCVYIYLCLFFNGNRTQDLSVRSKDCTTTPLT